MALVYLGLGSNLGQREANLRAALERLARSVTIKAVSPIYETEPVGYREQPLFLNAAACGETPLSPEELLKFVQGVEKEMGRRPGIPGGPRLIDIDILLYGEQVMATPRLTIPHPRLAERAFVLVPLADLAPELVHPVCGKKVMELLAEVGGLKGVRRWPECLTRKEGMEMAIREFKRDDYYRVWQLWQAGGLGAGISQEEVRKKLERDPDLFLVLEINQAILGVVMGAWDGRYGWLYNHAVDPACRRTGIGSQLLGELERRLAQKGATQIALLVDKENLVAQDFYEVNGFKADEKQQVMLKTIA